MTTRESTLEFTYTETCILVFMRVLSRCLPVLLHFSLILVSLLCSIPR